MAKRSYDGPEIDGREQYITERPGRRDDELEGERELVYATEPEPPGEERVENVRVPVSRPDAVGQTTLEDWSR